MWSGPRTSPLSDLFRQGWHAPMRLPALSFWPQTSCAKREVVMAKKIDIGALPLQLGTFYPPPYDQPCRARERRRLGDAAGLTQFGVNLLRLPPGAWASQRHWHTKEDEFTFVVQGEVVLVTDDGEEILKAGDCAGFPASEQNGHHLQN